MEPIVKTHPSGPGQFEAEAAGLRWLAGAEPSGGARIVRVIEAARDRIVLERITTGRADAPMAAAFGSALAATHDAGAASFGAKPAGWDGPVYIGRMPQPCRPEAHWGRFYAEQRVRPFLAPAVKRNHLRSADAAVLERACDLVASGVFDDADPPARLHGDLWNGNVLWSPTGVVLIDPAAHGGHRETDLAMLDLFGCPHLPTILSAYEQSHPLPAGRRERIALHQLHPLAVHTLTHGPAYAAALVDAARRTLSLA